LERTDYTKEVKGNLLKDQSRSIIQNESLNKYHEGEGEWKLIQKLPNLKGSFKQQATLSN